jgi:AcrR family transcriptional regulator
MDIILIKNLWNTQMPVEFSTLLVKRETKRYTSLHYAYSIRTKQREKLMSVSRRDHLVDTAMRLFCKHGFRATGIDTVLTESGVAKKTLYNHFKSKHELIIATLQQRDEQFLSTVRESIVRLEPEQDGDPRMARIMAFFDALDEWARSDNFNGCTFINASAEFPRREDPIHVYCANHKKLVVQFIAELIAELKLPDTQRVARELSLLVEGAIVTAYTTCDVSGMKLAKDTARRLLMGYQANTTI